MNAAVKLRADVTETRDPLAKLRERFEPNQISKLPKPSRKQTEELKADFKKGARCGVCGGWHQPDVVHLDYVGHAALTDRLLDTDPQWFWEPLALRDGLPAFDATGGLWIKLTVCGVSRLGYGHAAVKPNMDPGAREKEVIGDALRNAAMRFGAALDLWHKGDLHAPEETAQAEAEAAEPAASKETLFITAAESAFVMAESREAMRAWLKANGAASKKFSEACQERVTRSFNQRWAALDPSPIATKPKADDFGLDGDDIPNFGG